MLLFAFRVFCLACLLVLPVPAMAQLVAATGDPAAIPVPANAEGLQIDPRDGAIAFTIDAPVKDVADFYRTGLKPPAWRWKPSVIANDNMVVLDLERDRKTARLTIMRMGPRTRVSAEGRALEPAAAPAAASARPAPSPNDPVLEVHDARGLPVPKPYSSVTTGKSRFRQEAGATVRASLAAVLAFYRAEAPKRGWTEQTGAMVTAGTATLDYATADGPLRLTLKRDRDTTQVELVLRLEKLARESGLMPKPGQATILIGNMLETEATVTIKGQTFRLKPEEGAQGPTGPKLEVPPGTITAAIRAGGKPLPPETFKVGADEIWGLVLGPGGGLPLQLY
jgi:hypothetical protein